MPTPEVRSAAESDTIQPLAWWQHAWYNNDNGRRVEADQVRTYPSSTPLDRVAGDQARAAGLDANPTQGFVPGSDVIPALPVRTYQGVSRQVPESDRANPRSQQTGEYVDDGYAGWSQNPFEVAPIPPRARVVDRVQIPVHPVFDREPKVRPSSALPIYY